MKLILALCLALGLVACTAGGDDPDPSVNAGAEADGGGSLPFMADCTDNAQCETGLCYQYNMGAQLCTHACSLDSDCADPSPGCSGMGVCKRPQ